MFEPLSEAQATEVLEKLRVRTLSYGLENIDVAGKAVNFTIAKPIRATERVFQADVTTLIPVEISKERPSPILGGLIGSNTLSPEYVLNPLNSEPVNTDIRLLSAFELWKVAQREILQRSKFLTFIAIIDSLAGQTKRPQEILNWLDSHKLDAARFKDQALLSGLENLKHHSRKSSVRTLIERAATFRGLSSDEAKHMAKTMSQLYDARSALTHHGTVANLDFKACSHMVKFLLKAASEHPSLLDEPQPSSEE
ncbi:HEPN domain-containing protein [Herbaspirillum seropedicae]|uniref:HEPN domain-containing protein n=1 Tax=Herbaspirillum seropedicae TaxID=964 RepID=UPI0012EAE2A2|nr:HEPN domain-containing protein [Herbaspirillum seropedicae]